MLSFLARVIEIDDKNRTFNNFVNRQHSSESAKTPTYTVKMIIVFPVPSRDVVH
jgi:hypothetical protein